MESIILQIWDYSFSHKKTQWTEDELDLFLNPLQELWNSDNPQVHLSFQISLSLTHSSEATYKAIHSSIKQCYTASTMLSFDQVQNQLKRITGIIPLCASIHVLHILVPSLPWQNCQGAPVAYPPVTGQGCLNRCGSAKAGWVSSASPTRRHTVSDIYTTDHNRLPSVDCDAFGLTANVSGIKVWVIPLQECLFCGEYQYKQHPDIEPRVPHH
jgi:hypothetical protein